MKKGKDSTASLRGSRRKTVVAKCPPVDAYRDVRGARTLNELRDALLVAYAKSVVAVDALREHDPLYLTYRLKKLSATLAETHLRVGRWITEGSGAANH